MTRFASPLPRFRTPVRWIVPLLLVTPLVGACGDESPFYSVGLDTGAGADIGSDDAGADVASDTEGAGDTLPSVDTAGDTTEPVGDALTGAVTVFETRSPVSADLESAGITASFVTEAATLGPAVATIGPCEIRPTSDGAILFEDRGSVDVGALTVSIDGNAHALTHNGAGYDAGWSDGETEAFDAGDSVTANGAGNARFGSFSLEIAAPDTPEITAPEWEFTDTHDREDDLQVQWSGSGGTDVIVNLTPVEIFPAPGVADGNGVTCVVADTGTFTVPAAALAYLPEGGGFGGGSVALTVARLSATSPTTVAGGTVTLTAAASWTIVGGIP